MTAPRKLTHGWNRDKTDLRDWKFAERRLRLAALPRAESCEGLEPDIWDQGQAGSCTGHGTLRAIAVERAKLGLVPQPLALSRLMAYLLGRIGEGTIGQDAGAEIRDVVKGLASSGCCREELWPYDIARLTQEPPDDAWTDALGHTIKAYARLDNRDLAQLKSCIADHEAFVLGFDVPASFEGDAIAADGILRPVAGEPSIGGHCVCAIAYDDAFHPAGWPAPGGFLIANSWATAWGDPKHPGHFWVPYAFITSPACSDFWHVTAIGYGPSSQPAA